MKVQVPYGESGHIEVEVDDARVAGLVEPNEVEIRDETETIRAAINRPINSEGLRQFLAGPGPVLFIVNDAPRPTPTARVLDVICDEIPDLETSSLDQLTPQLTTGVLVDSFICCGDAFLFEQGSDQNLPNNSGTSSCQLLEAIEKQTAALEDALKVLPSGDELLILSPSGVQCRDEQTGWAFSRIGMLIDGFRSVRELMEDSPFSPCQTLCHLARAASDGLAYKKKFPELARVRMTDLDGDTRVELLEKLEQATTMAAEPIRILEKMRQLHQISGEEDLQRDAALRIADAHRSARNPDSAIAVLEEILEEVPDHESARASHIEILVERAEQLLTGSQPEEGRRYLRRAIEVSDDDQLRLRLIASHHAPEAQIREGIRIASLLHRNSEQRRALRLVDSLEALHPENPLMQQARVDFLLDHGEAEASEVALERLAARQASDGNIQRARQIADSVRKLRRKRGAQEKHVHTGQLVLRRIRQFCMLAPFLAMATILVLAEFRLQAVIAGADTLPPEQWKKEAQPWLRWLPPGPWKNGLDSAALVVEQRNSDRSHNFATAAREALLDAKAARLLGDDIAARKHLQSAIQYGAATEAKQLSQLWKSHDSEALNLRSLVDSARERGDLSAARHWVFQLLEQYPANDATTGVTVPVQISTRKPSKLQVPGKDPVDLPAWIEVPPFGTRTIRIEREGRFSEFVIPSRGPESMVLPHP